MSQEDIRKRAVTRQHFGTEMQHHIQVRMIDKVRHQAYRDRKKLDKQLELI